MCWMMRKRTNISSGSGMGMMSRGCNTLLQEPAVAKVTCVDTTSTAHNKLLTDFQNWEWGWVTICGEESPFCVFEIGGTQFIYFLAFNEVHELSGYLNYRGLPMQAGSSFSVTIH
jgi:hypothetical protein